MVGGKEFFEVADLAADFQQEVFRLGEIHYCLGFELSEFKQLVSDVGFIFHAKALTAIRNHDAQSQSVMTERANAFCERYRGSGVKV